MCMEFMAEQYRLFQKAEQYRLLQEAAAQEKAQVETKDSHIVSQWIVLERQYKKHAAHLFVVCVLQVLILLCITMPLLK